LASTKNFPNKKIGKFLGIFFGFSNLNLTILSFSQILGRKKNVDWQFLVCMLCKEQ
jgi:hypothetical protein